MKKRITSIVLALCLLLPMLPTTALAADIVSSGSWGNLTWSFDNATNMLTISGDGDMPDTGNPPFSSYRWKIKTIKIESGVTSIGDNAFHSCSHLTSVSIPQSATSIGDYAFSSCSDLTGISIPNGVTSIGNYAFSSCSDLTSVSIPQSVTSIGDYAFRSCSSLTSVSIPDGVKSIGAHAFDSSGLTEVTIPGSVELIGRYAFDDCEKLADITVSEGVTSIGECALAGCKNISHISLPNSLTSIGEYAFSGSGGVEIVVPGSVETIETRAFSYCSFERIVLSEGIKVIGADAFSSYDEGGNLTLSSVTLPNTLTTIGNYAFRGCKALKNIEIPAGVKYIGDSVFCESGLTEIEIPEGVLMIEDSTFMDCVDLKKVVLPDTIAYIGWDAFSGCNWLEEINIPKGIREIREEAFQNCTQLKRLVIPEGVVEIGAYAFRGCANLTDIKLPETLSIFDGGINADTFSECDSLTRIEIPQGVDYIGQDAFTGCDLLETVYIPGSVKSIGKKCFNACPKLKDIYYGGAKWQWDQEYRIPNSLTELGIPAGQAVTVHYFPGGKCGKESYWYYNEQENLLYIDNRNGGVIKTPTDGSEDAWTAALQKSPFIYAAYIDIYDGHEWDSSVFPAGATIHSGSIYQDSNLSGPVVHKLTQVPAEPRNSSGQKSCQTGGNTEGWKCEQCAATIPKTLSPMYFEKLAHVVRESSKSATCVDPGYRYKVYCSDCKDILVEPITIPPTGKHSPDYNKTVSKIVLKPATETESGQGVAVYLCRYCDATVEEKFTIPSGTVPDIGPGDPSSPGGSWPVFTVTFDPNGGALAPGSGPKEVTSGGRLPTLPANPVLEDHKFNGWYTSSTQGARISTATEFWSDATVYARWVEDTGSVYSITFEMNDGSGGVFDAMATGANGKLAALPAPEPAREGFTFIGWFTEPDGGDRVSTGTLFMEDTTVYARWEKDGGGTTTPGDATVTVDLDGGTLGDGITTLIVGSDGKVQKPAQDPVRPGYIFIGWYKDSSYTEIWDFSTHIVNSNTTIYAKWEEDKGGSGGGTTTEPGKVTVTINFNGGGTLGSGATTLIVGPDGKVERPADPVRPGYTFINWYEDSSCTKIWDFSTHIVNSNTTIYAKWEKDNGSGGGTTTEPGDITVTINLNGGTLGSGTTTLTVKADGTVEKPADPTRPGYIFMGWYKDSSYTEIWDFSTHIVNSNTTIYAKWEKDNGSGGGTTTEPGKVTVTINFNGGGTLGSGATTLIVGPDGKVERPADPTRPGYIFMGWYEDSSCTKIWDFSTHIVNSNTTIYVKWEKDSSGTATETYYRIHTDYYTSGGSVYMSHTSAVEGARITIEVSPRSGYELDWLSVYNLNTGRELTLTQRYYDTYTFSMPNGPVGVEVSFSREDLDSGSWYVPETISVSNQIASNKTVRWYYKDGQIRHVTDGIVPYGTLLTRDMLISILYNMDTNSTGEPLFWATLQKVMPDIYPSGLWGTDKNISREQAAMILYNYSRHMSYNLSPSLDLSGCADYAEMRPIARPAMSWAQATGLFSRNSLNMLSPKSTLTCGEANTLLSRFVSTVARTR